MTNTKMHPAPARALHSLINEANAWEWEAAAWPSNTEYENGHEFAVALMLNAGFETDAQDARWELDFDEAEWLEDQLRALYYDDLQHRDDYGNRR